MAEEEKTEGKLLGFQVERESDPLGSLPGQVDADVAIGERHHLGRAPSADQSAGAGHQFLERERLAEVVVGAAVEAAHPVLNFAPIPTSRIGELAANWEIVLAYSPEA
jgi:hypothetical protein